ncbi:hypothetical protein GBF38_021331 [Nibea albiflora]|uniref:Uncharacterized protein n=1 Tax=Nibea albiflora TaxID=240163 RepID=A0ACB7FJ58_NIBAL|nr:hypothetical protein GBF38_021331 [Nibea albiflora]
MAASHLIVSIITLLWIEGVYLSKEKQVFQSPTQLLMKANSEVNLTLTHKIPRYDTILWYQRSPGDTSLKLIGYIYYKTPTVESQFQSHFKVSGDGEKTAYLHILNLRRPEDSGEYFGAANSVLSSVVIQQSVNPLIKHEGEEARLDCYHGDNDYPYMFWYQHKSVAGQRAMELIGRLHYENPTLEKNFAHFNITGHSKRRAQLVISNIKPTDTAEYFCAANGSQAVLITQWPHSIIRVPSALAEMHCYQNDTDYQYMYWYRQRGETLQLMVMIVGDRPSFEEGFKSGFQAAKSKEKQWSLTIPSVQSEHEAVYLCAASLHSDVADLRSVTKTYSEEARLTVVLQSGDQISDPGGTVVLECSVAPGFSMSSFTMFWYQQNHYGAPIEFLIKEHEQTVGHFKSSIDTSRNKFSLQITELSVNDSSTYYCAARHSAEHRPDSHTNNMSVTDGVQTGRRCGLFGFYTEVEQLRNYQ